MTFVVVNKFLQGNNRTFVAIRQEEPYTAFDRVLIGDRTNDTNDDLIKAVLAQVTIEFNPADSVKQLQEDLITQEQTYNKKLAEKEAQIAKVKAIANWSVLARVTDTDNPLDPTLYKKGLELVDLGQTGKTYNPQEIFTLENPNHIEQFQEGKRVMVQVNEPFTYQGQTLEQLEELHQNGKIGLWKWEAPTVKPSSELETQAVPQ